MITFGTFRGLLPEAYAACKRPIFWTALVIVLGHVWLRYELAEHSPFPFGYIFDRYYEAIDIMLFRGSIPESTFCWQCYHPPVWYIIGGWFVLAAKRIGRDPLVSLAFFSTVCNLVNVIYAHRLFRLYGLKKCGLLAADLFILSSPAMFIMSYSAEADTLLCTWLIMTIYYLCLWHTQPDKRGWSLTLLMGVLSGLSMATKFNGLVGILSVGVVLLWNWIFGRNRTRTAIQGLSILLICMTIGSWKYIDNYSKYDNPMWAQGSANIAFQGEKSSFAHLYEFYSLRLGELWRLYDPILVGGNISKQPVYYSVPTSLHAMLWSDMSFFSVPMRHGDAIIRYPKRDIPILLIQTLLLLGLVPVALSLWGFAAGFNQKRYVPLYAFVLITLSAYYRFVVSQELFSIKIKYIVFLLPAFVIFGGYGYHLIASDKRLSHLRWFLWGALWFAIVFSHIYCYEFATGSIDQVPGRW